MGQALYLRKINDLEQERIFFGIEPEVKDRKRMIEEVSKACVDDIEAIEFYGSKIGIGGENYDAAIVCLNPTENKRERILQKLKNFFGVSKIYSEQKILGYSEWYTTKSGVLRL